MQETNQKNDLLLTLEESHLEIVSDVVALSERTENLWRESGVLKWKARSIEKVLIENKPFLTSISQQKLIKNLHRHLTILEKKMLLTVNTAQNFEKSILKSALTAGSL